MALSISQVIILAIAGDGSSTTFSFDVTKPPVINNPGNGLYSFQLGTPSEVVIEGVQGPQTQGTPFSWQSEFAYPLNRIIQDSNGNAQKVTTAGTSDVSQPIWAADIDATTSDGNVVWTRVDVPLTEQFDNPSTSVGIIDSTITITFGTAPLEDDITVNDVFGNSLIVGAYIVYVAFIYNG